MVLDSGFVVFRILVCEFLFLCVWCLGVWVSVILFCLCVCDLCSCCLGWFCGSGFVALRRGCLVVCLVCLLFVRLCVCVCLFVCLCVRFVVCLFLLCCLCVFCLCLFLC